LLTGGVSLGEKLPPIPASWITATMWAEICRACNLPGFKGFMEHFCASLDQYKELNDHPTPNEWVFPEEA